MIHDFTRSKRTRAGIKIDWRWRISRGIISISRASRISYISLFSIPFLCYDVFRVVFSGKNLMGSHVYKFQTVQLESKDHPYLVSSSPSSNLLLLRIMFTAWPLSIHWQVCHSPLFCPLQCRSAEMLDFIQFLHNFGSYVRSNTLSLLSTLLYFTFPETRTLLKLCTACLLHARPASRCESSIENKTYIVERSILHCVGIV